MDIFLAAHCAVSTPTCGPCLGGYMGILAAGERAVATTNRNFVGRMGDPTSEVYLASPAVAAASAVLGHLGLPDDLPPRKEMPAKGVVAKRADDGGTKSIALAPNDAVTINVADLGDVPSAGAPAGSFTINLAELN